MLVVFSSKAHLATKLLLVCMDISGWKTSWKKAGCKEMMLKIKWGKSTTLTNDTKIILYEYHLKCEFPKHSNASIFQYSECQAQNCSQHRDSNPLHANLVHLARAASHFIAFTQLSLLHGPREGNHQHQEDCSRSPQPVRCVQTNQLLSGLPSGHFCRISWIGGADVLIWLKAKSGSER